MTSRSHPSNISLESAGEMNATEYNCCPCHGHPGVLSHEHQCAAAVSAATVATNMASRHITFSNENRSNFSRTNSHDNLQVENPDGFGTLPPLSLEARVEELEEKLDLVLKQNAELKEKLVKSEMKQAEAEGANNELYRRLGILITTTGTLSERLKSLETTTFTTLRAELDQQRSEMEERDVDVAKLLSNFKEELSRVSTSSNELISEQKQVLHEMAVNGNNIQKSPFSSIEDQIRFIETEVRRLVSTTLDDFQRAQTSSLQDMAKKLEQEIDKRHRRLVESTQVAVTEAAKGYETAAPQIRTLQNEMLQVKEQIRVQAVQMEAQRNDTSFEHAINEMKDWVQDIERKLITRTEVEEAVLQLSSQLSSIKHSTQSNEAILNQKLEMEKNTRESAVSQLATQLLMSGKKR